MSGRQIAVIIVLILVVIGLAVGAGAALLYYMSKPARPAHDSILEIQLTGNLAESPRRDPWAILTAAKGVDLWDLRRAITAAKNDDRVAGIFLEIGPFAASWAQVAELRSLLQDFKSSGKPVYAFLSVDAAGEGDLLLASVADVVALNPVAGLLIDGLLSEVTFYKRALDKLGVKAEFFQFKEYKNPGTYTRTSMTPEFRSMLEEIIGELQSNFVADLAAARGLSEQEVRDAVARGLLSAVGGQEARLVDRLAYRSDLVEDLRQAVGADRYRGISLARYLKVLPQPGTRPKARIAYVTAEGVIVTWAGGGFGTFIEADRLTDELRQLREDDRIDGVILRVNSPGGSAVASDMIWKEIARFEEGGKPVVVSMSGTAASGGYYIALSGRRIVAQPSTITGSVGVIFGKFDLSGFYDWLGIDVERVQGAPNAGFLSLTKPLSPEQQERVLEWMEETYDTFVRRAAEGRGLSFEAMEAKARGRIYTGRQAREEGLIDALGGIQEAVALMKEELGLGPDEPVTLELYPKPKTVLETLMESGLLDVRIPKPADLQLLARELETPRVWLLAPSAVVH
ncbi:MAG: S49 family peptidase [Acidobacteriota bacterium]